ncbi:MAG: hypothetical protein QXG76_03570 [Candidatus Bathyarchaeia archaeon]
MEQTKRKLLTAAITLTYLAIILSAAFVKSASASIKYGYKEGDQYQFFMEGYSEVKTEKGSGKSSYSNLINVKIEDIETQTGGYGLKIELTTVGYYGAIIDRRIIEGNRTFESFSPLYYAPTPNLFTSTDWDERAGEWDALIKPIKSADYVTVKVSEAKNGVFKLEVDLKVKDTDAIAIDYDDDGDRDGYTGWMKLYLEYDQNGVLKSFTYEIYREFTTQNTQKITYKMSRGGPSLIPMDILMYIVIGVVCFVVALFLGYFIGKRRAPKAPPPPTGETLSESVSKI